MPETLSVRLLTQLQHPPDAAGTAAESVRRAPASGANIRVLRRDRLGGPIHEYAQFA